MLCFLSRGATRRWRRASWPVVVAAAIVMGLPDAALAGTDASSRGSALDRTWGEVLASFVVGGGVDYESLARQPGDLDAFLSEVSRGPVPTANSEATAFWINAYNAVVLSAVVELYPEVRSVKDVDGFFDERIFAVGGEELTLDEIESRAMASGDPRIHFALVCAAESCPPLLAEPYLTETLEQQLEAQTRAFLADEERGARYDAEDSTLWLSSLFKWYGGDFTGGSDVGAFLNRTGVRDWVRRYLPQELAEAIADASPRIRYFDYDWTLNDRQVRTIPVENR